MTQSATPLFRAIKSSKKKHPAQLMIEGLPEDPKPVPERDPLDYDPTPPDATAAFLAAEAEHMLAHGNKVWENAVGGGHMAHVLTRWGFDVVGSDVVHRGWPEAQLQSFYEFKDPLAPIVCSNPPYCEITSRAHGRWMWHTLGLGLPYVAYLLSAEWCAARINSMDELFAKHPPSIEYLCTWKIDFRGQGQAPQRNSFFVWDENRPPLGPDTWVRKRLFRDYTDPSQGTLL